MLYVHIEAESTLAVCCSLSWKHYLVTWYTDEASYLPITYTQLAERLVRTSIVT